MCIYICITSIRFYVLDVAIRFYHVLPIYTPSKGLFDSMHLADSSTNMAPTTAGNAARCPA